jgi:S-DNA-T family DNA segregation ATPase FtsK/SpoIIIE
VIVVDEFAAMLRDFPQLHDVFADIAARGRSLGMHLILCTQRPAGVVRDALLANCELRLSLRVNNAADSTAIIGSPAASTLPPTIRGRCYVAKGGARPELVQVAYTDPATIASPRPERTVRVRTPWLPPLPPRLMLDSIPRPSDGLVLGLLDLPEHQSQPSAVFVPAEHGHLLVLGSPRAGKTTLLDSLNRQHPNARRISEGVERAWDELRDLAALCRQRRAAGRAAGDRLVLIDDLDSVLREFEPDYQAEMLAELALLLRDGPSTGITIVATAQRLAAPLSALAPLFSERILLRFSNRQDYLVAEGLSSHYDPQLPAGAGHWRGSRLQLAIPSSRSEDDRGGTGAEHESFVDPAGGGKRRPSPPSALLVVTPRPGEYLERSDPDVPVGTQLVDASDRTSMSATAPRPHDRVWMIATPDAWLAAWATFSVLRGTIPVRFDGCSLSDFRALTRRRELPPPVERGRDARWLLTPDGTISRC